MCLSNPFSWFRLNHDITKHPYFKNALLFQFFVYLLDRVATHKQGEVERGCIQFSVIGYAKEFNVPHRSVRTFIDRMVRDGTLEVLGSSQRSGTTLKVVNYERYQFGGKTRGAQTDAQTDTQTLTQTLTQTDTQTQESPESLLYKDGLSDSETPLTQTDTQTLTQTLTQTDAQTEAQTTRVRGYYTGKDYIYTGNKFYTGKVEAIEAKEEERRKTSFSKKEGSAVAETAVAVAKQKAGVRFVPPSLSEVQAYAREKGAPEEQALAFWNYYESNGWKVGKNKMQKWKAAFSGWLSRSKNYQTYNSQRHEASTNISVGYADRREFEQQQRGQETLGLVNRLLNTANAKMHGSYASDGGKNAN